MQRRWRRAVLREPWEGPTMFGTKRMAVNADLRKRAGAAINRAPVQRRQESHTMRWGLLGLAAGAAAMFMFDPRSGNRRRALLRDQLVHAGHVVDDLVTETLPKKIEYAVGFARGMEHDAMQAAGG